MFLLLREGGPAEGHVNVGPVTRLVVAHNIDCEREAILLSPRPRGGVRRDGDRIRKQLSALRQRLCVNSAAMSAAAHTPPAASDRA